MADYTVKALADVTDMLGDYPGEMRLATYEIDAEQAALTWRRMPAQTGGKGSYGHRHKTQEEIYLVVSGTLQFKLDDDVIDVPAGTVVRVAPHVVRSVWNEGPDDVELVIAAMKIDDPRGRRGAGAGLLAGLTAPIERREGRTPRARGPSDAASSRWCRIAHPSSGRPHPARPAAAPRRASRRSRACPRTPLISSTRRTSGVADLEPQQLRLQAGEPIGLGTLLTNEESMNRAAVTIDHDELVLGDEQPESRSTRARVGWSCSTVHRRRCPRPRVEHLDVGSGVHSSLRGS